MALAGVSGDHDDNDDVTKQGILLLLAAKVTERFWLFWRMLAAVAVVMIGGEGDPSGNAQDEDDRRGSGGGDGGEGVGCGCCG